MRRQGIRRDYIQAADDSIGVEEGSGNVFADLDLPNPDVALAKAELVRRIRDLVSGRKLSERKAAELLGLERARFAALVRGQVGRFSFDRLFRCLNALGQQVEITVRPKADVTNMLGVVVS
jgi:predicted XRE-type DNA-binding protein